MRVLGLDGQTPCRLELDCEPSNGGFCMRLLLAGILSAWLWCVALDAHAENIRKIAEASMLVKGTIQINPDGTVNSYVLDRAEKLPQAVIEVIQKNIPAWKFEVAATSGAVLNESMSVRVLAKAVDAEHESVSIIAATFGDDDSAKKERIHFKTRQPPHYPPMAIEARVSGTVFLLIRIDRDGRVQDGFAEQVNLRAYGEPRVMDRYRKILADAALKSASEWTYDVPTQGKDADAPYWLVRVPVSFDLRPVGGQQSPASEYGHWDIYVPGPKQEVPWVKDRTLLSTAPDAIPDGALQQLGSGPRLVTPLGKG
ncbi:energy transducer TonB [Dyella sp. Tek66A03]|uniref:energy transducer TonB n=1 Tax=Dyella sp. Tek66A03 TaxID=3458298 RepID=UPI00403EBB4B